MRRPARAEFCAWRGIGHNAAMNGIHLARKKLPIGIQTFAKIREDDAYYYVDKTPLALRLIGQGSHFFSRVRAASARACFSTP